MRLLLDAKDLIDIIQYGRPVDAQTFDAWLRRNDAAVVLSFTNVSDFVGPTFANGTFLETRILLQEIEKLPLTYMREGMIIQNELKAALAAYRSGVEPEPVNPYVARWDETGFWENESASKILVGLRLDQIVFMARMGIQSYKQFTPSIREYLQGEREIPKAERWSLKKTFINRMPDRISTHRLDAAGIDVARFGGWLWRNPARCLGLRLFFEAHHQLIRDSKRPFLDGDTADFAHIAAVPYADFITVDKRIADLLSRVFRSLRSRYPEADLSSRVFPRIGDLLARLP